MRYEGYLGDLEDNYARSLFDAFENNVDLNVLKITKASKKIIQDGIVGYIGLSPSGDHSITYQL